MTIDKRLDDEKRILQRDEWFARLEALFAGKSGNAAFALNGELGVGRSDPYREPEQWVDECLLDLAENKLEKAETDRMFVPLCVEYGIYGVHYVDKMLGARVYFQDGQWYNDYLTAPVGALEYPDLQRDETFQLSLRAARRFAERAGKLPLFGLPTIASPLNVAVNLYGQEFLMELLADPDKARQDLEVIARLQRELHKAFRAVLPMRQLQPVISWNRTQPPGYGQICGCTTQLVSGELYADAVKDLDESILNVYEHGGMMHLCGAHTQHMETFRNMQSLKALQLNDRAAEDLAEYYKGLREDQILYLNPCEGMSIERALEITGGRRLVIAATIDRDYRI